MKTYSPSDVRVVGFFGHRGSGKTSLVEGLLCEAGTTKRAGSVEAGNLTLELDDEARSRGLTMHANVGFAEWNGARVHVVDTPGDGNFWGAAKRASQIVDAGVVTVSAADGVEPMTTRAMQALRERRAPFAVVVTKLDKDGVDFQATVDELAAELDTDVAVLTVPMGEGGSVDGVIGLIENRAYVTTGDSTRVTDVPGELEAVAASARERLIDAVAATDDDLAERYLEEGSLEDDELRRGLRAAFLSGQLVPVLASRPPAGVGSRALLDVLHTLFPSPLERPAIRGYRSAAMEEPVERIPDPGGPLVAQVFRTYHDPFAGVLTYARVWSGSVRAGTDVFNSTHETSDRPSHMFLPLGATKGGVELGDATVGDLVALTKLKATATGDTLCSKDDPTFLPPFQEPEALLHFGITAVDKKADDKMAQSVAKLILEDPSLRYERDPDTGETLLGGLGQSHVDHVVARLAAQNIDVKLEVPKVPYRETLRRPIKNVEGKHKKQTGGSGQFGVCFIDIDPLPRGSGIEFVDEVVGGAIPRNYIPSVEKGVRDALRQGPVSGSEMVDLRVTLTDGKYHRVDSSDVAFQIAGRKAVRSALGSPQARPVLLEPYMEVEVTCPAESVGDVMGDLNSRRARVHDMITEGKRGRVTASVPMNEVLKYTNALKSITSGRGSFTMRFERYEEAPGDVQEQVAGSYQHREDED